MVVECAYDSMGRRTYKKVTTNGTLTLYQRYIYRGFLQIACLDLTRSHHPCMWFITWDPSQSTATRPLAIQISGTWLTYGWDLTKNTCELYSTGGTVSSTYTYSPFGKLMVTGSLTQPIQWSGEMWDAEVGMVYYNYRYYNPGNGRWLNRDFISRVDELNPYLIVKNNIVYHHDFLGLTRDCSSAEKKEMREDFEYALKIIKTNSDVAKKKIEGYLSWSNITIVKVIERDKKLREYECTKCREKWYTRILPWSCEKYTDLTIKTILKVAYIEGFELNREEANKILTQIDLPSIPDILSKLGINIASQYKIKDFRFKVTYNKICTAKELELYC